MPKSPLHWLEAIIENDNPLPPIGNVVHAQGDVIGLVVGYRKLTPQSATAALVQNVNTGNPVLVLSGEVISSQRPEDYIAKTARFRPVLACDAAATA